MGIKEKIIGIVLIILGAIPFLSTTESISETLAKYPFLVPGETGYQVIIMVLGVLLIWKRGRKIKHPYRVG